MKFQTLLSMVPDCGLFRSGSILAGSEDPHGVRRQLSRWVRSGRIVQLRREVYLVPPPHRIVSPHPFLIANTLRRASYVSLQSALSYHGMIPEHVPVVTSVTGGRPEEVDTPTGHFQFRHVAAARFFGFREWEVTSGQTVRIATPEKALVDLLYLTPGSEDPGYLEELRIELPGGFDIESLGEMAEAMKSPKVGRAVVRLADIWRRKAGDETTLD